MLDQLQKLFGSIGEEVPQTTPRQPRRLQDAICVSYRFLSPLMGQEFEVCLNTLKGRVSVMIIPPYGNMINAKKEDQVKLAIDQVRTLLELENGIFKNKQDKVLS